MENGGDQGTVERSRTLALSGLPPHIRKGLVATLGPRGATIVRALDGLFRRERMAVVLAALGLLLLPALFVLSLGEACAPSPSLAWVLVNAACLAPSSYLAFRMSQRARLRASLLVAPGVYITLCDVILVRGDEARFVPMAALAGISAPRKVPFTRGLELTLRLEGEGEETVLVPADEAEGITASLERARLEATMNGTTGEVPRRARRGADPLADLKGLDLWEKAKSAAPRSDRPLAMLLGLVVALGLGFGVLQLRNAVCEVLADGQASSERNAA